MGLLLLALGCSEKLGACPTGDDRYQPSVGPDACFSYGGIDDSDPLVECPGGDQWDGERFVIVHCGSVVCLEEYACGQNPSFCTTLAELEAWKAEKCPNCNISCHHEDFDYGGGGGDYCFIQCLSPEYPQYE